MLKPLRNKKVLPLLFVGLFTACLVMFQNCSSAGFQGVQSSSSSSSQSVTASLEIVTQPTSLSVIAGNTAVFSVVASGGSALTYQWMKDGSTVSGATSATLSVTNVSSTSAGSYTVIVSSQGQQISSIPATLTVLTKPTITQQPTSQTVNQGGSVSFSVGISGTSPFTYQWQQNGASISGATSSSLNLTNVQAGAAGNYTVVVTNSAGSVTSAAAVLTYVATPPAATPPSITTQPVAQSVNAGASVTFTVVASGTAPLTYQWSKNGVNISGATSALLNLGVVTSASAGNYSVLVSNAAGSVSSTAVALSVLTAPVITQQPLAQTLSEGTTLNLSVVASGTSLTYQWQFNGVAISGQTSSSLSIGNAMPANSGSYLVVVSNAAGSVSSTAVTVVVNAVAPTQFKSIKVASQIACGVGMDNTFWCWGVSLANPWSVNLYPQQVDLGGKTILDYDVSDGYTSQVCFVFTDNTLSCKEGSVDGMGFFPTTGLTGFKKVRGGIFGGCAMKTDDSLWCWGYNGSGDLGVGDTLSHSGFVQPIGVGPTAEVAFGQSMTCAVTTAGQVYCWGNNGFGQLGTGATGPVVSTPQLVPGIANATKVVLNTHNACALLSTGNVTCWGSDGGDGINVATYGSLGQSVGKMAQAPTLVPNLSGATDIIVRSLGYCVKLSDSSVRCWGNIIENEGIVYVAATPIYSTTPVAPGGIPAQVMQIAGGPHNLCALDTSGNLYCLGNNRSALMGLGGGLNPQPRLMMSGVSGMAAGGESVCAIMPDGSSQCIGDNWVGQFGNSNLAHKPYSTFQPLGLSSVKMLQSFAGPVESYMCAVDGTNSLNCWGMCWGAQGVAQSNCVQYGQGENFTIIPAPIKVSLASTVQQISLGDGPHTCVLLIDGSISCWGRDDSGELGNGAISTSALPTPQPNSLGTGNKKVVASASATCWIAADSTVKCVGKLTNVSGEEPVGPGYTDSLTPESINIGGALAADIQIGGGHTCILTTAGAVLCQGRNASLQTSNSSPFVHTQVQVPLPAPATKIITGENHSCALINNGDVYCWGYNLYGQLGNGGVWTTGALPYNVATPQKVIGVSNVTSLSARNDQTCAINSANELWCWGMVYYNEVNAVKVHW